MKRNIIFALAIMFAIQLFAAADGTYKKIIDEYTLTADGGITQKVTKVLRHNTHHSFFTLFGETFVVYNPEYQKIKIDTSYTVQKDGTIIKTPENAFNYVLPSIAAKAPDYNKLTELVVTHTGLELGATSYLQYTVTTEPGVYNSLDIDEIIGVAGADIDKYQVIVNIPEGTDLRWSLTDSKVKPTVKGGRYTWTFSGVKSAKGEENTPYGYGGVPHLSITTSQSLADNLMPLTIETRDLRRAPREYMQGATDDLKRAEAIQKYIVNGLGTCKVQPFLTANSVRQCGRVMETAYGTEAEKALAMAKLMRAEGLDAHAVVAFPAAQEVKTIRNIAEYMVLCGGRLYSVRTLGESLLKWRTSQYSIFDLAGNEIEMQPTDTEITLTGKVTLSAKEASQDYVYSVTPLRGNEKSRTFTEKSRVSQNSGYITYTLPSPATGCVDRWSFIRLNKERTAAFAIPYKVNEKNEYTIALDGVTSVTKNVNKSIKNSVGSVNISIVNENGKIVIKRSIALNMDIIPAGKYKEFYEIMRLWNNPAYRKVVAKK